MITKVAMLYQYTLPMNEGVILRHQRLKQREGLMVYLKQGEHEGWGEIAPLPEFSQETLEQAQAAALDWLQHWSSNQPVPSITLPSVAFGISCAVAELNQQLPQSGNYQQIINCTGDPDELFEQLNNVEGEKIAEVKVGFYESVRDGMIVNMLLEAIPDLKLRLEGRQSWTLAKAQGFAKYINPDYRQRIIYLSEPCKTPEESTLFAQESGISLGWDASLHGDRLNLDSLNLTTILIKPTLIGSLDKCCQLIQHIQNKGLTAIITSSIESGFGLSQLARIAQQYTPNVIPNLNTLNLMLEPWPDCDLPILGLKSLKKVYDSGHVN